MSRRAQMDDQIPLLTSAKLSVLRKSCCSSLSVLLMLGYGSSHGMITFCAARLITLRRVVSLRFIVSKMSNLSARSTSTHSPT